MFEIRNNIKINRHTLSEWDFSLQKDILICKSFIQNCGFRFLPTLDKISFHLKFVENNMNNICLLCTMVYRITQKSNRKTFIYLSDQVSFVGVQLVIRCILNILPYKIFKNTPHHSCNHTQVSFVGV